VGRLAGFKKGKKTLPGFPGSFCVGGDDWNRTNDTRIFSPLLYQLSYITNTLCFKSDAKVIVLTLPAIAGAKNILLDFVVLVAYHYVLVMHNKF
jgi:hypothetical protein